MTKEKSIFEVEEVKNFKDYIGLIADMGDGILQDLCLFRGQPCDKPLIPRIGRSDIENIQAFETKLFQDFQKRYQAYSRREFSNDWDLLALGQHFGLPTRLLDWTENSLMALWFTTEQDIKDEYGVVWMFIPNDEDILKDKDHTPFNIQSTKVFSPNHISERITAQSGWFTCHKLIEQNRFLKLETLVKYREKLMKIKIPSSAFPEIRVKLNTMGINTSSVYPDLTGLTKHLTWKNLKGERF